MSRKEYFAYGSNLNFEQMAYRCPEATVVGTAKLDGYELAFRRGYLTILPKEGASVEGLIWSVTDHDESQLDCYEGYPTFYDKGISVRRFTEEDAEEVSKLVVRNFLEVNSKDYGIAAMEKLAKVYDSGKVLNIANYAHMYVFEWNGKIVGTGSISSFWGSKTESILLTIFVLPELHGKGIGRKIINTLEQDEFYVRATRIEIPASITATEFYRKFGYDYKNGVKELDEEHHYRLEKFKEAGQ